MDIAGEDDHVITTWDGLVHCGMAGLVCSGSVALRRMAGGAAGLVIGFRSKDTSAGVGEEE